MKVAIQGVKGAFHEEAAIRYFKTTNLEIVPNLTFKSLINSIENGDSDIGIIAVENTISGTIHHNLNLVKESKAKICGEVFIRIKQNLAAIPGTKIKDIEEVQSHYMAINQCRQYLSQFKHIKLIESEDTALTMRNISESRNHKIAAIGSSLAAKYYDLEVIAPEIETNKQNYTRFWIISKEEAHKSKNINKASINLILPNSQGSLARILNMIAEYSVDLTKIESQPIIGQPWNYMFYIDLRFEYMKLYQNMLDKLNEVCISVNIMGEYEEGKQSYNQIHSRATAYDSIEVN